MKVKNECVSLSRLALAPQASFQPTSKELSSSLQNLLHLLHSIDNPDLVFDKEFGEYLFFPIRLLLEKPSLSDLTTEYVIRILNFLVRYAWATTLAADMAKQLLILMTMLVGGPPSNEKINKNLKLNETGAAGCEAIQSLFHVIGKLPSLREEFSKGIEFWPSLGHTITVLLDCAVLGVENLQIQKHSIGALTTMTTSVVTDGDVLASLTPGIISSITKILGPRNTKRHYTVLVQTLDLFKITLTQVFNDKNLSLQSITDEISNDPKAFRTQSWLTASQSQVKLSLNSIAPMRSHSRPEVMKSLLDFSTDILTHSVISLQNCIPIFIDNIVFIASLENSSSPDLTESAFFQFGLLITRSEILKTKFNERIYEWIESLPRLLTAHDENQAILILGCIHTSLKQLSNFASDGADLEYFQDQFIKTLQTAVSLKSSAKLLPEMLPQNSDLSTIATSTDVVTLPQRHSTSFGDLGLDLVSKNIETKLKELLIYIGSVTKNSSIFENTSFEVQSLDLPAIKAFNAWITTNTFEGLVKKQHGATDDWLALDSIESSALTTSEKDDLSLDMYDFCTDVFKDTSSSATVVKDYERYDNATLCFALQGMENVALYMGENFKTELVDVLYPLIDFLGSPNQTVRGSAQRAIIAVAKACGYPTVRSLLTDNSDYIIDALSTKLNTLEFSPQGPVNLTTLIKLSGASIIPYLDDVIESLFAILDNYHGYSLITNGIFQALESLVEETGKGYKQRLIEAADTSSDALTIESRFKHTATFEDLLAELSTKPKVPDFYDTKGVDKDDDFVGHDGKPFKAPGSNKPDIEQVDSDDEGLLDFKEDGVDPTTTLDNEQEQEEKDWKSPIPKPSYELVKKIVGYSDRFLTHDSSKLRKLLINLTSKSLDLLSSSTEEFLPLVNQVWPVLVLQLDDSELFIVEGALEVIGMLCEKAKDFMTTRITAIWPKLKGMLPKKPETFLKRKLPKFSVEQRTVDAILSCLEVVARSTRLETNVFFDILETTGPFLLHNEQLAASLSVTNSDAVWFEMAKLRPQASLPFVDTSKYPTFVPFRL